MSTIIENKIPIIEGVILLYTNQTQKNNKKTNVFLGWIMVTLGGLCYALIANFTAGGAAVANTLMMKDPTISISRTVFGMGFTFWALTQGIPQPFIGKLIQKKGPKLAFILGGCISIIVGLFLSNFVGYSGISFVLIYGIGGGTAFVLSSQLASQTLGNNWFVKHRGTAQSLLQSITVISGVITPILANWLIKANGGNWRYGYYMFGITGIIGLILALFIVNKPSDKGQFPDGIIAIEDSMKVIQKNTGTVSKVYKRTKDDILYKDALRMHELWAMSVMIAIAFMVSNLANSPGPLYFTDQGISMDIISTVMSLRAAFRVVILVIFMRYLDRIEPIKFLIASLLIMAIGLIFSINPTNTWQVVLFFFSQVTGTTAALVLPGVLVANYFGVKDFPRIQGMILLVCGLISSLTSIFAGAVFDITGSYNLAFYILAALSLVGCVPSLFIKYPRESKSL